MSELFATREISDGMMDALLREIAIEREAERLSLEFIAWQRQRQIRDERLLASILRGWGIQVGEA